MDFTKSSTRVMKLGMLHPNLTRGILMAAIGPATFLQLQQGSETKAAQAILKVGRGTAQLKAPVCLSQISLPHLRIGAVAVRHVGSLSSRAST
eukprot:4039658-Pyramimonas_sp.AAC.1